MVRFATVATLLAACSFRTNPAAGDAKPVDAVPIDLPVDVMLDGPPPSACTAASATCLDGSTLETCAGPSAQPKVTTCSWGCVTTGTDHCGMLAPAGGAVMPSDLVATGTGDVTLAGNIIDTDMGTITGVTAGYTHTLRNGVQIFRFKSLTVSGIVTFTGTAAVAFVASDTITVDSTIVAQGPCGIARSVGGPGGGTGAPPDTDATGSGGGGAGTGNSQGGGGGGYGGKGGKGGNSGGAAGAAFGDDTITLLVGGGGGGGGHNRGGGGGGGGAIQLVSDTSIVINSGGINAGGCGGSSAAGDGQAGGGGGGAGGTILLEAPTVRISGALAVNGGAGGGNTTSGGDGSFDRTAATNGDGGGTGGAAATTGGGDGASGGGGGGAVGRIRVNTLSGQATVTGVMSPSFSDNKTATQGIATIN